MKKKILSIVLCMSMLLTSCAGAAGNSGTAVNEQSPAPPATAQDTGEASKENEAVQAKEAADRSDGAQKTSVESDGGWLLTADGRRPSLLGDSEEVYYDRNLIPSLEPYSVAPDFSNVVYNEEFSYLFDGTNEALKGLREHLTEDLFAVDDSKYDEFFEVYEGNRYVQFPSFITVDSLMHTYHLYFAYLMRNTEKDHLAGTVKDMSLDLLEEAADQYRTLSGTKWENAAFRNICFMYVGALLFDDTVKAPVDDKELSGIALEEVRRIHAAKGILDSPISGLKEDYTQYKPRGYYAGDKELETYFRAMMWYGRMAFDLREEDMVRSALLMTSAVDRSGRDAWRAVYDITSFFAGASDDPGYYEIADVMKRVYGRIPDAQELSADDSKLSGVIKEMGSLTPPAINSIPVDEGDDPVIPCYRLMGQRFTIDEAIMQKLVFSAVGENPEGVRRMIPDVLDTAAVLGSQRAEEMIREAGAFEYEGFDKNFEKAREHFAGDDPALWNASLYAAWLNTLRPLLDDEKDGYPSYTHSEKWRRKSLETYCGSYAELKHDTILYAKQLMAEMGGGDFEKYDDRGFVDPQPQVYSRFISLARKTKEGLSGYGMLDAESKKDLELLEEIAERLLTISEKELSGKTVSDEEYEFIRCYGGDLEHLWEIANSDNEEETISSPVQSPCPIVADIATDPNGSVLEVGTGFANNMYVVFPIDGELHVGRGSVYDFYQFEQPLDDRLTDDEWRTILSDGEFDEDYNWIPNEDHPDRPAWTTDYRLGD